MKRIYTNIISFLLILSLTAQNTPNKFVTSADSLQFLYNHASSDTARLAALFRDKPVLHLSNPDLMIQLYQRGYEVAKRYNDKTNIFKALHYTALIYMYGKSDEGTAFQWLIKALPAAEEEKNYLHIQWVYTAMGIIHHHQGNTVDMKKAFYKSVEYAEQSNFIHTGAFYGLSAPFEEEKRYDEQLDILRRLVRLLERNNESDSDKLVAYTNLIKVLERFPDKNEEHDLYLNKALAILGKDTKSNHTTEELLFLASANYKLHKVDAAIKYAQQVISLPDTDDALLSDKGQAYQLLAEVYEKEKNDTKALFYIKKFHEYEYKQLTKRLTEDAGRKAIQAAGELNLTKKQKEIEQQKLYTWAATIIAVLILGMGGMAYFFYRREQEKKMELSILNKTKDKLFALLSHDLISPVDTLKNYTILMDWGAMTQETFAETLQRFKTTLSNTSNMLENVLHWAVSQMGGMTPKRENVNVSEVLKEQIALVEPIANDKKIQIQQSITTDVPLHIDKNHLALILRNLLQNALKFTNKGGTIQFSYQNTEGGKRIRIEDNGIGMTPEIRAQLFQIDKNTQRTGTSEEKGTGLGLILTKELVELNGGTIDVSSKVGTGTIFTLTFS